MNFPGTEDLLCMPNPVPAAVERHCAKGAKICLFGKFHLENLAGSRLQPILSAGIAPAQGKIPLAQHP